MTVVGIATINENEQDAVRQFLAKKGFVLISGHPGPLTSRYEEWQRYGEQCPHLSVILLRTTLSGNLAMAACIQSVFFDGAYDIQFYVLFGCAAGVRGKNPLAPGQVVLVREAIYGENGLVELANHGSPGSQEVVLIKMDRLAQSTEHLNSGLTPGLATALGVDQVVALATDKVIKIDPMSATLSSSPGKNLAHYHEVVKAKDVQLIDMESYGFMMAMGQVRGMRAAIIRVVTDFGDDHGNDEDQRKKLNDAANQYLSRLLGSIIGMTDPEAVFAGRGTAHTSDERKANAHAILDSAVELSKGTHETSERAANDLIVSLRTALMSSDMGFDEEMAQRIRNGLGVYSRYGYGDIALADLLKKQKVIVPSSETTRVVWQRMIQLLSPQNQPVRAIEAFLARYFSNVQGRWLVRQVSRKKGLSPLCTVSLSNEHGHELGVSVSVLVADAPLVDSDYCWSGYAEDTSLVSSFEDKFRLFP